MNNNAADLISFLKELNEMLHIIAFNPVPAK